MKDSLSRLVSGQPSEDLWQKEFYRAASSLIPPTHNLSAEVSRVFGEDVPHRRGEVDFYVDEQLQWMVEFLVGGRDLLEHLHRFDRVRGRYRHIPCRDWLVVDFRLSSQPPPELLPNVLYILYESDFTSARAIQQSHEEVTLRFEGGLVRTLSDL